MNMVNKRELIELAIASERVALATEAGNKVQADVTLFDQRIAIAVLRVFGEIQTSSPED